MIERFGVKNVVNDPDCTVGGGDSFWSLAGLRPHRTVFISPTPFLHFAHSISVQLLALKRKGKPRFFGQGIYIVPCAQLLCIRQLHEEPSL